MTCLVAFDGSELSKAALRRAEAFVGDDDPLLVVSVVPTDEPLAETYDLVEGDEYDPEAAAERLRSAAKAVAPDCEFRARRVDPYAGKGRIATEIGHAIREIDADLVVVGSENAGRVVEPVSTVGSSVASGTDYDVLIVRSA
ncbi:universal stress protein [Natronomonas marina]|jgi:nucleotide-binding universal stress UspA family protein|uniref:universal stress protein n=1 Tax=Natronomonas marina TaxID=2961939 RepID=UPI0020C99181|nr:universal stress protein [Natronomonas marina]